MPIIFFKEHNENTIELEPYCSFGKKFKEKVEAGIDGSCVTVPISNYKGELSAGFEVDRYYANDIRLKFCFNRNPNSTTTNEEYLVHHTLEFDFDLDFEDIQRGSLEDISKRSKYFYIEGVSYYEFTYQMGRKSAEMRFDVLTSEKDIDRVCNQLISHDIAIFSRGW